jgi:hypothetical protein
MAGLYASYLFLSNFVSFHVFQSHSTKLEKLVNSQEEVKREETIFLTEEGTYIDDFCIDGYENYLEHSALRMEG